MGAVVVAQELTHFCCRAPLRRRSIDLSTSAALLLVGSFATLVILRNIFEAAASSGMESDVLDAVCGYRRGPGAFPISLA